MENIISIISEHFWQLIIIAILSLSHSSRSIAACMAACIMIWGYNVYVFCLLFLLAIIDNSYSSIIKVIHYNRQDELEFDDDSDKSETIE